MVDQTPKPDDRSDNVEKLQQHVQNTIENIEAANETLENGAIDGNDREAIEAKNARREEAIEGMRKEIIDEARDH
ncbi:small acid-soluble spore protein (thioredoxin-like protein) [Pullulanibacillus pueri]|uniref:Small, acid-soluble spore protein Tlp n=1 Tax=Pullulanibacillus pueri TaxID=1437324 RepID=A0A8J2ZXI1_9BACL|nr:small acid-soluble spore protein Tlp [Pullulanibacillus pueri]MBM7683701.1 small acid-soluble spore protein (thioredoxin-like protein) [Pullulanibacillus pueri]GGH85228.1 small, acid-soluble spore protein Tlp [Pullulanibacillus pueri]